MYKYPQGDSNASPQVVADKDLRREEVARAAESGATDADLTFVMSAWRSLPDAVRAGIVAMVKAAAGRGRG